MPWPVWPRLRHGQKAVGCNQQNRRLKGRYSPPPHRRDRPQPPCQKVPQWRHPSTPRWSTPSTQHLRNQQRKAEQPMPKLVYRNTERVKKTRSTKKEPFGGNRTARVWEARTQRVERGHVRRALSLERSAFETARRVLRGLKPNSKPAFSYLNAVHGHWEFEPEPPSNALVIDACRACRRAVEAPHPSQTLPIPCARVATPTPSW